jgi:hypothetical protein
MATCSQGDTITGGAAVSKLKVQYAHLLKVRHVHLIEQQQLEMLTLRRPHACYTCILKQKALNIYQRRW